MPRRRLTGAQRRQRLQEEQARGLTLSTTAHTKRAQRLGLTCFKCGSTDGPYAATGTNRRGHWAICVTCRTSPTA